MTEFEKATELFNKIVQGYEKQLEEASYQFQATVMAANHEMERMMLEWTKNTKPKDLDISGNTD